MIRHYLNFISSGHGRLEIQEPTSFDGAKFEISQEDGRMGRDVFLMSGEKLQLNNFPEHYFEIIQYNIDNYGFEAIVKYEVRYDDSEDDEGIVVVGEVDFETMTTDQRTYCDFAVIEETEKLIFNRRYDVKTNLFSPTTLDDAPIDPVQTKRVLVKAHPIIKKSRWEGQGALNFNFPGYGQDFAIIAPFTNLKEYDIGVSYAPAFTYQITNHPATNSELEQYRDETTLIRFNTNAKDVKISMKGVNLLTSNSGFTVNTRISIGYGTDYEAGEFEVITIFSSNDSIVNIENQDYEVIIPYVTNTSFLFIQISVGSLFTVPASTPVSNTAINFSARELIIEATTIGYNTVVPMVRLIDAMRYNARSSSDLPISAPRWDFGGEYYDTWITTQALMRNLTDKPFNISAKDIVEEYMPIVKGDYQIQKDGAIFYGKDGNNPNSDFYRNIEIGNFDNEELAEEYGQFEGQIEGFEVSFNKNHCINKFKFAFKNFASQRESERDNTYDIVHGNAEFLLANRKVENTKNIEVGFIFDAFLWEESRQRAYDLSDTAATSDDDKIFALDVVELTAADRNFTETAELQHKVLDGNILELTNTSVFSWLLLGVWFGTPFSILSGENVGNYAVSSVSDTVLKLLPLGGINIEDVADENTTFKYQISPLVTSLVNRTNEGFQLIENISDGDNYSNLRYTVKRNILENYNSYLATCNIYRSDERIKKTVYNNNPEAITQLTNEQFIKEGEDFIPENPILTPRVLKAKIIMSQQRFFEVEEKIRTLDLSGVPFNGFIRIFDATGLPVKGYIRKATWTALGKGADDAETLIGICEMELEEKYQPFDMEIFGLGEGSILINNEIAPSGFTFSIDGLGKLSIFDENGKLLFVPVSFNRVKVNNGGPFETVAELAQTLNNL